MSTQTKTSILKTLAYADIFNFPLTMGELAQKLITNKPVSKPDIIKTLNMLEKSNKITTNQARVGDKNKLYALKGRNLLFKQRHTKNIISEKKTKQANIAASWLYKIPNIKAIYLTGSVAVSNSHKNDDIDLMIITNSGHLWSVRLLSVLALDLKGIRRKPENAENSREASGKICANLFLDLDHLQVPKHKQNLYTAHEVIQAKPLLVSPDTHQLFLYQNSWIKKYLANTKIPHAKPNQPPPTTSPLHPLAYYLQKWYMNKKITNEFITSGSAYFHPRNTSSLVISKYHQKLAKLGIQP